MRKRRNLSTQPEQSCRRSLACIPTWLINTRASTFAVGTGWGHPGNFMTKMFRQKNIPPLRMPRGLGCFVLPETPRHRPSIWHPMTRIFSRRSSLDSRQAQGYCLSQRARIRTSKPLRALRPTSRTNFLHYLRRTGRDSQGVWLWISRCFLVRGPGTMT